MATDAGGVMAPQWMRGFANWAVNGIVNAIPNWFGPMLAIELVSDANLTPNPDLTLAVTKAALARGLIVIRAGLYSNCLRFLPPLTITDDQIDEALAVLDAAFDDALAAD